MDRRILKKIIEENISIIIVDDVNFEKRLRSNCDNKIIVNKNSREIDDICEMYRCYEFSDRVLDVSKNERYGGIMNLVSTGVLSIEEAVKAILGSHWRENG